MKQKDYFFTKNVTFHNLVIFVINRTAITSFWSPKCIGSPPGSQIRGLGIFYSHCSFSESDIIIESVHLIPFVTFSSDQYLFLMQIRTLNSTLHKHKVLADGTSILRALSWAFLSLPFVTLDHNTSSFL